MTDPLVSVIIPAHNVEEFIGDSIGSVLAQTYPNYEIIVIDDGSTDGSADTASRLSHKVKVIRQANLGAAAARNAGIDAARGNYIAFLDGDDWWHPRKLELQVQHLQQCDTCIAAYCCWKEWTRGSSGEFAVPDFDTETTDPMRLVPELSGLLYTQLLLDCVIHTSSVLFRRATIETAGHFDTSLRRGQDLDYWLRTSRLGEFHKLAAVLSAYRVYQGSAVTRPTAANYRSLVIEKAIDRWGLTDTAGNACDPDAVQQVLRRSWLEFGLIHLDRGSTNIATESFRIARAYRAPQFQISLLKARAILKSLFARSDEVLDSRHHELQAVMHSVDQ